MVQKVSYVSGGSWYFFVLICFRWTDGIELLGGYWQWKGAGSFAIRLDSGKERFHRQECLETDPKTLRQDSQLHNPSLLKTLRPSAQFIRHGHSWRRGTFNLNKKEFYKEYKKAASFLSEEDITFGYMDVMKNEVKIDDVSTIPQVLLYNKYLKDEPVRMGGRTDFDNLMRFLENNAIVNYSGELWAMSCELWALMFYLFLRNFDVFCSLCEGLLYEVQSCI